VPLFKGFSWQAFFFFWWQTCQNIPVLVSDKEIPWKRAIYGADTPWYHFETFQKQLKYRRLNMIILFLGTQNHRVLIVKWLFLSFDDIYCLQGLELTFCHICQWPVTWKCIGYKYFWPPMKLFFSETGSNDTNILDTSENSQFDTTLKLPA